MNNKIYVFLFILISFKSMSQTTSSDHVEVSEDKRQITVHTKEMRYFTVEGEEVSDTEFSEFTATGNYNLRFAGDSKVTEVHLVHRIPDLSHLIGEKLPILTFQDTNGLPVTIGKEKCSLLNFWSTTCGPCIKELTVLNILSEDFPNILFYAITTDSLSTVKSFFEEKNIRWKNLIVITDYNKEYELIADIKATPTNVILDKENTVLNISAWGTIRDLIISLDKHIPLKENQ